MDGRRRTRLLRGLRLVGFAVGGSLLALALAGRVRAGIGPFETTLRVRPGLAGTTTLHLAPLGTIGLDTHDAPVALDLRVDELALEDAQRITRDPAVLDALEDDIARDARDAVWSLALRALLVAVAGGTLGALVAAPRWRPALLGAAVGFGIAGGVTAATAATFDAGALARPRYSGLLTIAPTAVGDVRAVVTRFGEYRAQLTELVGNVVTLYQTAQGLPVPGPPDDAIRVLHVSDIHLNPQAFDLIGRLTGPFRIDAVIDTGDITDWGTEPEGRLLERIGGLDVPYVWVRGNHDSAATQAAVAAQPRAVVLDGRSAVVAGLRIWGGGDPRYTPDKGRPTGREAERDSIEAFAPTVSAAVEAEPGPVDVVAVHDARAAVDLGDKVPLVLSGHTHEPRERRLGGTLVMVEGSTGGAGLRGLQAGAPEPLTASVLYFDRGTRRLVAYDRITVAGFGGSGVRIERHIPARPSPGSTTTSQISR